MKYFFQIVLLSLIVSCVDQKRMNMINDVDDSVSEISQNYGVQLTYEVTLSDESTHRLVLTVHDSIKYAATYGAMVSDIYESLEKKGILYDRYIIKNVAEVIAVDYRQDDLIKIIQCQSVADKLINDLVNNSFSLASEVQYLDSSTFNSDELDQLRDYCESSLDGKITDIGFELTSYRGDACCVFVWFVESTVVSITVNLTKNDCKVFNINFSDKYVLFG